MVERAGGESLLFLTDEQLRKGIEAMFFAYRGFTADPDRILEGKDYGRAHHRAGGAPPRDVPRGGPPRPAGRGPGGGRGRGGGDVVVGPGIEPGTSGL